MPEAGPKPVARYEQVKNYILERIASGELKPGDFTPSENEFTALLGVSRMTANRALRELTAEGYLERTAGVGTFVSRIRAQSHLVQIRNIAEEVHARGHAFRTELLALDAVKPDPAVRAALDLKAGETVPRSLHVHYEEDVPIQMEERYVSTRLFPGYLTADLSAQPPSEYLMGAVLVERAEHTVSAIVQTDFLRDHLHLDPGEPCLLLERLTWARGERATFARLYHPGSRYQLTDRFDT